jgi:hypothetical protein
MTPVIRIRVKSKIGGILLHTTPTLSHICVPLTTVTLLTSNPEAMAAGLPIPPISLLESLPPTNVETAAVNSNLIQ